MRVLLAGGGTAGHINPALSIAAYAKKQDEKTEILFIGKRKFLQIRYAFYVFYIYVQCCKHPLIIGRMLANIRYLLREETFLQ